MLKPLKANVIVLPNEALKETKGGLVVPENVNYNPEGGMRRGKVVSVGDYCREVKVGDEACYMAYTGLPVQYEGTRYLMMPEAEILGITSEV